MAISVTGEEGDVSGRRGMESCQPRNPRVTFTKQLASKTIGDLKERRLNLGAHGALQLLCRRFRIVQCLQDLLGEVDSRAGPDRLLENYVVLLGLRNLPYGAIGSFKY